MILQSLTNRYMPRT